MSLCIALFLFLFGPRISWSQLSPATCEGDGYVWLYNSRNQSPCDMAAYLTAVCQGSSFTIYPLPIDHSYMGPQKGYEEPCSCSTITWTLFAACTTCQNETSISWSLWSYNCSNAYVSSFAYDIPPETAIPDWAYLPAGTDDTWNITAAWLDLGGPESTATLSPPSTSSSSSTLSLSSISSGPPRTTDDSDRDSQDSSPNLIGPIIGGVVGGVAILAILAVGIIVARRRYVASRRPPSTLHGPQGTSPYRTTPASNSPTSPNYDTEHSMHQKLYDPTDPTTYLSPLSYESSTTAYTWMPDSPSYGQQTYQTPGADALSPNRYINAQ